MELPGDQLYVKALTKARQVNDFLLVATSWKRLMVNLLD